MEDQKEFVKFVKGMSPLIFPELTWAEFRERYEEHLAVRMNKYMDKLLERLKKDPLYELRKEFGQLLMRHIGTFSKNELKRYEELKEILADAEKKKRGSTGLYMRPDCSIEENAQD